MKKIFLISFFAAITGAIIGVGIYNLAEIKKVAAIESYNSANKNFNGNNQVIIDKTNEGYPSFVKTASLVVPTVVHVKTTYKVKSQPRGLYIDPYFEDFFNDFFGRRMPKRNQEPQEARAAGSGVIISSDGYIVTNNHVVDGSESIEVVLNDKRSFNAKIIGTDPDTDLALIKIEARDLKYLEFGDSDSVQVGEWVMAIGNPLNLNSTVTAGIISAKARNIGILRSNNWDSESKASAAIEAFLQTDAVINRGNSGGPLVNITGQLIGINAAIASQTGFYEGYGFAIPSNLVKKVIGDLKATGKVRRAMLGITFTENNADFAKEKKLPVVTGLYVQDVIKDGAAAKAGIKSGDIITKVDNRPILEGAAFQENIARHLPGETIKLTLLRKGKEINVSVKLRDASEIRSTNSQTAKELKALGAKFKPLTQAEKDKLRLKAGVKIISLDPQGVLAQNDLKTGFIIESINNRYINSESDIRTALGSAKDKYIKVEGWSPNDNLRFRIVFPLK
ncbi:MAG: Do family serine endopeptidase [Solitalea-like symbiont of Tyrophagus putrescentiae]